MKILSAADSRPVANRVLGLDGSTNKLAFTLLTGSDIIDQWGAIMLPGDDIYDKIGQAAKLTNGLLVMTKPDFVCIEAATFVNNMSVVKKLAMVFGATVGTVNLRGVKCQDVPPTTWQGYIGNPVSDAKLKAAVKADNPTKSATWLKAEARRRRKQRTIKLVADRFSKTTTDDDVADSAGIAWYAWEKLTRRQ